MKNYRKYLLSLGITAMGMALCVNSNSVKAGNSADNDVIAKGVLIGNVDVGGMTSDEAESAVNKYVDSIMNSTFTLKGAKDSIEATASQMGIKADTDAAIDEAMAIGRSGNLISRYKQSKDLEKEPISVNMHLGVNRDDTANLIYKNLETLNVEAKDSTLSRKNGEFEYVPGTAGIEVDVVNSVYGIEKFLSSEWDGKSNEVALVTEEVDPKGTQDDLAEIKDLLGKFSTDYSSSKAGRAKNVANACSKINGSIIYPGEEFSVYEAISPIEKANGYEMAGAYQNGQVVESVGGGVCQVATTLYNAVIRSEMEITMRYNHSMLVNYVPPSDDAAIAGGTKDLRFKNTLDKPVYIEGVCSGGIITFSIYGVETRDPNREISFESETISTREAKPTFQFTESPLGSISSTQSAHLGMVARLWKVVKVNGKVESRKQFNASNYNPSGRVITVGLGGATASQVSKIKAAAASGNEASVRAAVNAAKAENTNKAKEEEEKKKQEEAKKKEEEKKKQEEAKNKEEANKKPEVNKKDDSSQKKDTPTDNKKNETPKKDDSSKKDSNKDSNKKDDSSKKSGKKDN